MLVGLLHAYRDREDVKSNWPMEEYPSSGSAWEIAAVLWLPLDALVVRDAGKHGQHAQRPSVSLRLGQQSSAEVSWAGPNRTTSRTNDLFTVKQFR
jgi:hypothetical protein